MVIAIMVVMVVEVVITVVRVVIVVLVVVVLIAVVMVVVNIVLIMVVIVMVFCHPVGHGGGWWERDRKQKLIPTTFHKRQQQSRFDDCTIPYPLHCLSPTPFYS